VRMAAPLYRLLVIFNPFFRGGSLAKRERKDARKPHVLVALDDSPQSSAVLRWGAANVFEKAGKITFVHATEFAAPVTYEAENEDFDFQGGGMVVRDLSHQLQEIQIQKGLTVLGKLAKESEQLGYKPTETKLLLSGRRNSIKYSLLDYIKDTSPDLVICGSRGMGTIGRAMLGSVADCLVHNVDCSVTVVKEKHHHHHSSLHVSTYKNIQKID